MGVLIRKERGGLVFTGMAKIAVIGFIVALASSFIDTIWSLYMNDFVNSTAIVGFISAGLTLVAILSYFFFIPLVEKNKKSKIYFMTLVLMAITYVLFAVNDKFYVFVVLAVIFTVLVSLRITSFGIIVKDRCREKQLPRNEGLMYSFLNVAWVIGPLVAGIISQAFGISIIFFLAAIFVAIAAIIFKVAGIKDARIKRSPDRNVIKNFKEFFEDKWRVDAYVLGMSVGMWWILIYLFIPLYMLQNKLDTMWVGYFLFAIAIPLIIFEFPFSKLSSKIGFKKVFRRGFVILFLISVACFLISNVYIVLALLVLASIGMAFVEPTAEAYFFEVTEDSQESRFYGPYNTSVEASHFIGKVLASVILIFFAFKYVFLLYAFFMMFFIIVSFRIREVQLKKKKKRK